MGKQRAAAVIAAQQSYGLLDPDIRQFERILFLICPTGAYCREDRCQSFFEPSLVPSMRPPLEECEAGGAVSGAGATFVVIDSPALKLDDDTVMRRIVTFDPDLIVLSVTFGSLEADLGWASRCKERFPHVPLGLRGAPCYVEPQQLLRRNRAVDFCVRGDYELIFRLIVEFGLERTAGVVYRDSSGEIIDGGIALVEDLDGLPFPDRSGIDPRLYTVRGTSRIQATIRVQRGCPFPCTYCLVHTVSGNRARHRSAESVVAEIQSLLAEGVRFFYLRAETFTLDRAWALSLVKEIARHCPGARWVTTTRAECVDDEILEAMKAAGCYGISFGLDVASKEIAVRVKKPVRRVEAQRAIQLCRQHGIISLAYIMIGFVWDTPETLHEAGEFIRTLCPDLVTVHYAHPYPGTVYFDQVRQVGNPESLVSRKAQAEPALALKQLSTHEIQEFGRAILRAHRRRPKVWWSLGRNLLRLYVRSA